MSREELIDHIEETLPTLTEDRVDGFIEEMMMEYPQSAALIETMPYRMSY